MSKLLQGLIWSALTIGFYCAANQLHRRWPRRWLLPVLTAPIFLGIVLVSLHVDYRDYIHGTSWMVWMLGPTMVAFAVPIFEQRDLIRGQWPVLLIGMLAGTTTAMLSSWALASLVGIDDTLLRTLLPRSISSVFAMEVAGRIGGVPGLAAVFAVITGVLGAIIGDLLLARISLRSALARGAMFGLGAHAIGTAQAYQVGRTEGAVAGLVMVLAGVLNVLVAPLLAMALA